MRNRVVSICTSPLFILCIFLGILTLPHFVRGEIIGPFDLLASFYHPYRDILWSEPHLADRALHYKNYLQSDAVSVVLPVKLLAIHYLKDGILPLWNPLLMNGIPLFANIQTALLYPTTLLYLLLPAPIAYTLSILMQPIIAFSGMYFFLRKKKLSPTAQIIGCMSFSFSAYMVVWLAWGTIGHAIAWLPWLLYAVTYYEESPGWLPLMAISLATTASMLAGHTQSSLLVLGITLIYIHRRLNPSRHTLYLTASVLIGTGIALLQIIPSIEMYRESARELLATPSFFKDQTLNISSFIQLLFPDFFGNPVTQNWWGKINYAESAIYFGCIPALLALYGSLRSRISDTYTWVGVFILGLLTSTQNPISQLIFHLNIPVFSSSTFGRNSLLIISAGSILAAYGADTLIAEFEHRSQLLLVSLLATTPFLVGWTLVITKNLPPAFIEHLSISSHNMIPNTLILLGVIAGIWGLRLLPPARHKRRLLQVLLILGTLVELFRFTNKYTVFSPHEFFYPKHQLIEQIQKKGPSRYFQYIQPNTNAAFSIATIEGSEPLYPKRLGLLAVSGDGSTTLRNRAGIEFPDGGNKPRLFQLFSVDYLADKHDVYRNNWSVYATRYGDFDSNFKFLWTDSEYMLYQARHSVPHAGLYFTTITATSVQSAIEQVTSDSFDPFTTVVLEDTQPLTSSLGTGAVRVTHESPLAITYATHATSEAILATTDTYYPGWQARIDGKDASIFPSNGAFRAVRVPKGDHTVQMIYQPSSLRFGLYGSLASLAMLGVLVYLNKNDILKARNNHRQLQ